jgi:hypothetical protein
MIGKLRSTLIGLFLVGTLVLGAAAVSAATASATLTGGTLTITSAASDFSYGPATLTGDAFDLTSSFTVGVNDKTGSGAGWKLLATIGTLTDTSQNPNATIAASNHTLTGASASDTTGAPPTNGVSYPMQIPGDGSKIFSANAGTGKGKATLAFATNLHVPADALAGSYSTTMTVTIASGP